MKKMRDLSLVLLCLVSAIMTLGFLVRTFSASLIFMFAQSGVAELRFVNEQIFNQSAIYRPVSHGVFDILASAVLTIVFGKIFRWGIVTSRPQMSENGGSDLSVR